jgi:hypothetical protein
MNTTLDKTNWFHPSLAEFKANTSTDDRSCVARISGASQKTNQKRVIC